MALFNGLLNLKWMGERPDFLQIRSFIRLVEKRRSMFQDQKANRKYAVATTHLSSPLDALGISGTP